MIQTNSNQPLASRLALEIGVAAMLVVIAIVSRMMPHTPNFVAVSAVTIFAAWYFRTIALAAAIPIVTLLISDLMLGFYEPVLMVTVYVAALIPLALNKFIRGRLSVARLSCVTLAASMGTHFALDFVVWISSGWYEKSTYGLMQCYASGLPFLKNRLAGDFVWTAAIFGSYLIGVELSRLAAKILDSRRAASRVSR
jgi:hypothetical protein